MITVFVILWITAMVIWCTLFNYYSQLIRDVRCGEYKKPLIKQIVIRYDNCKKLNININNIDVFVEKIIDNYEVCGLSIINWEIVAGILEYIIVILGTGHIVGIFFSIQERGEWIYSIHYSLSAASLNDYTVIDIAGVIFVIIAVIAVCILRKVWENKRFIRTLIVEIADYLENSGGLRVPSTCCAATKLKGSSASDFERLRKSYKRIQTDKL